MSSYMGLASILAMDYIYRGEAYNHRVRVFPPFRPELHPPPPPKEYTQRKGNLLLEWYVNAVLTFLSKSV